MRRASGTTGCLANAPRIRYCRVSSQSAAHPVLALQFAAFPEFAFQMPRTSALGLGEVSAHLNPARLLSFLLLHCPRPSSQFSGSKERMELRFSVLEIAFRSFVWGCLFIPLFRLFRLLRRW